MNENLCCPVCGHNDFLIRISGMSPDKRLRCALNASTLVCLDLLTRAELLSPGEKPPFLIMTCALCHDTLIKPAEIPLLRALREHHRSAGDTSAASTRSGELHP